MYTIRMNEIIANCTSILEGACEQYILEFATSTQISVWKINDYFDVGISAILLMGIIVLIFKK